MVVAREWPVSDVDLGRAVVAVEQLEADGGTAGVVEQADSVAEQDGGDMQVGPSRPAAGQLARCRT
ncbi:MAG: hypothetical protein QOH50_3294 [Kribbellaceae bacterium]|jgi:hypothetical protein|nr:hypothetical protein [Kribbellaceae bacterium]